MYIQIYVQYWFYPALLPVLWPDLSDSLPVSVCCSFLCMLRLPAWGKYTMYSEDHVVFCYQSSVWEKLIHKAELHNWQNSVEKSHSMYHVYYLWTHMIYIIRIV